MAGRTLEVWRAIRSIPVNSSGHQWFATGFLSLLNTSFHLPNPEQTIVTHTSKNIFMEQATALHTRLIQEPAIVEKVRKWISDSRHKTINGWIIEQLHIESYQHILEVGYGSGNSLYEVAKKLQVGFMAGTDDDVNHYQQAVRRNKKFIDDDLLHLHLGSIEQLPYPPYYFHSIYTGNIYYSWKEPLYKLIQLHHLLKSGGKLVTVVQPFGRSSEKDIWNEAENIQEQYNLAGFFDVRFSFREMSAAHAISVVGYKD